MADNVTLHFTGQIVSESHGLVHLRILEFAGLGVLTMSRTEFDALTEKV